jgi:hypothetical protein
MKADIAGRHGPRSRRFCELGRSINAIASNTLPYLDPDLEREADWEKDICEGGAAIGSRATSDHGELV